MKKNKKEGSECKQRDNIDGHRGEDSSFNGLA
jgi:hypothetical protein